jgi:hypothetical protein
VLKQKRRHFLGVLESDFLNLTTQVKHLLLENLRLKKPEKCFDICFLEVI